jgi:hypothetical protein
MDSNKRLNSVVHLKSGAIIETTIASDRGFEPSDLTEKTVWSFTSRDRKKNYIVQGSSIDHIEIDQK